MTYKEKLKSPKWQKKRLEIFKRDGFQYQMCYDRDETLVVHHKYYINGIEPWEYENDCYITVCEDCHDSIHLWDKNFKMYPERYLIIPIFNNITDLRILIDRIMRIYDLEGNSAIKTITQLLTAYSIDLKDL